MIKAIKNYLTPLLASTVLAAVISSTANNKGEEPQRLENRRDYDLLHRESTNQSAEKLAVESWQWFQTASAKRLIADLKIILPSYTNNENDFISYVKISHLREGEESGARGMANRGEIHWGILERLDVLIASFENRKRLERFQVMYKKDTQEDSFLNDLQTELLNAKPEEVRRIIYRYIGTDADVRTEDISDRSLFYHDLLDIVTYLEKANNAVGYIVYAD